MNNIMTRLQKVFAEVLADESLVLRPDMTNDDVPNWDSLMHVTLMINIEKEFKVRFSSKEVVAMNRISTIMDVLRSKMPRNS